MVTPLFTNSKKGVNKLYNELLSFVSSFPKSTVSQPVVGPIIIVINLCVCIFEEYLVTKVHISIGIATVLFAVIVAFHTKLTTHYDSKHRLQESTEQLDMSDMLSVIQEPKVSAMPSYLL